MEEDRIIARLDTLITGQAEMSARLLNVEHQVDRLTSTVRGRNGTPGLVSEVFLMKETLKKIEAESACTYPLCGGAQDVQKVVSTLDTKPIDKPDDKADEKEFISWKWAVDKLAVPVATAFVIWFLLNLLPDIFTHLSGG